jgi:3-isopropylmalate/(R)-2-methylmalate dehydratase small subunit
MEPFVTLTAVAAPYEFSNVDTDRIIRIDRCARTPREELGLWAFEQERYGPDGTESTTFVLNRPVFRLAKILVAGENFGCGSSREAAVWAIAGMGVRCLIAPSFSDIFAANCLNNGLLAITLGTSQVAALLQHLSAASDESGATLTVDLRKMRISTPWGDTVAFNVEPLQREALLEGLDPIGVTLKRAGEIETYQARQRQRTPWLWPRSEAPAGAGSSPRLQHSERTGN